MMSRSEIDNLVAEHGFTLWATVRTGGDKVEYQYMSNLYGINLWVDPETLEFRMGWIIPHSVLRVECPPCSPITNEPHFVNMLKKVKRVVRILSREEPFGE